MSRFKPVCCMWHTPLPYMSRAFTPAFVPLPTRLQLGSGFCFAVWVGAGAPAPPHRGTLCLVSLSQALSPCMCVVIDNACIALQRIIDFRVRRATRVLIVACGLHFFTCAREHLPHVAARGRTCRYVSAQLVLRRSAVALGELIGSGSFGRVGAPTYDTPWRII
jgi:hypothetical protein